MIVNFLSNNNKFDSHDKQIIKLIENADEVWIAVAFLTQKGLDTLLPYIKNHIIGDNKKIHIIAGLNFAHTDPSALETLEELFRNNENAKLFMSKIDKGSMIFHPKLYIFRTEEAFTIISGSANLTNGGLLNNIECSLQVIANKNDDVCKETIDFLEMLMEEKSNLANVDLIAFYKGWWEKQKLVKKGFQSQPDVYSGDEEEETVRNEEDKSTKERKYYRLILGEKNDRAHDCLINGYIGLGYGIEEDLTERLLGSEKDFKDYCLIKIAKHYNNIKPGGYPEKWRNLWKLFKNIEIGDIFICYDGKDSYHIGEVIPKKDINFESRTTFIEIKNTGLLYYYEQNERLPHRIKIKWTGKFLKSSMPQNILRSMQQKTYYDLNKKYSGTISNTINALIKGDNLS